ncbi:hypothetical protein, partial [Candidatus Methylobacter favarea]
NIMTTFLIRLIGMALLLVALPSKAITLSWTPVTASAATGSSLDMALIISGLGDHVSPSLGVFDIDVDYEPSILGLGGVVFGDPGLGDQLALDQSADRSFTPRDGSVNLYELSFDTVADLNTLQAGSFTLATLSFNALSAGVSPLNISLNAIGDANADSLSIEPVTAGPVTVEANADGSVPEPATWLLVSLGVLVMKRLSWRLLGQKYFLPVLGSL